MSDWGKLIKVAQKLDMVNPIAYFPNYYEN